MIDNLELRNSSAGAVSGMLVFREVVFKLQKGLLDCIKTFQGDQGCGMKLLKLEVLISDFKYVLFSQNQSA